MRIRSRNTLLITLINIAVIFQALLLISCSNTPDEFKLTKEYENGDEFKYFIRTEIYNNSMLSSGGELIAHHVVEMKDGVPYEKIEFSDMKMLTRSGMVSMDSISRAMPPFYISLHPKGTLYNPYTDQPFMRGPIRDLITFYRTISPKYGFTKLQNVGEIHSYETLISNNWADQGQFLINEECLELEHELKAVTDTAVIVESRYMIPRIECLEYPKEYMREDTVEKDFINNFVLVLEEDGEKKTAVYGTIAYTIISRINPETGMLISGELKAELVSRIKNGCNKKLEECSDEKTAEIRRLVQIELIND